MVQAQETGQGQAEVKPWAVWEIEGDDIVIIVARGEAINLDAIGAKVEAYGSTQWKVYLPNNSGVDRCRHNLQIKTPHGVASISLERVVRVVRQQELVWTHTVCDCVPQ